MRRLGTSVWTRARRVMACLMALVLVAGFVPALPEAPFALAEEADAALADGLAEDGGEGIALGDAPTEGDLGESGPADASGEEGDGGEAVVIDEDVEDALLEQLERVASEVEAQDDGAGAIAPQAGGAEPEVEAQSAGVSVSNPRVRADSSMKSGQIAIWDCVWFGSYPQTEVTSSYEVYASLISANWDANGDATVSGARYRRISKDDATYNSYWSSDGYGSASYRYFRYDPIKWRVLKVSATTALVVADVALDDQRYNANYVDVTWETSGIRSWLNGYGASSNQPSTDFSGRGFLQRAFSASERADVLTTSVVNADNSYYGTPGGNATSDKVFLPSESEVYDAVHGFASSYDTSDEARRCKTSDYARAMGAWRSTYIAYEGNCYWWLRSPGHYADYAPGVDHDGYVYRDGYGVHARNAAVRPALNLNLASSHIQAAGTVSSNGDVNEQAPTGTGGNTGGEVVGGGFDYKTNGASFLHERGSLKREQMSKNEEAFLAKRESGTSEEVWQRGDFGFNGVSNYADILPTDFRRFFGSVEGNPGRRGLARILSLIPWHGSCAGISTAVATAYVGSSEVLSRSGKSSFSKVEAPFLNGRVLSLIQCYQLANYLDFTPKAWYDATFPYTGSVDSVIRRVISDIREDGVSMLCFHGPGEDHAVLAVSARGDISESDGTVRIGLYDVNSVGYQHKSTGEPFFTGYDCIEMEVGKSGGKYTSFKFLDANNWVSYYKGEGYVQFNQANTSLKVYDFKAEASTPLENIVTDLGFNLMMMAASKGLKVVGDKGSFGISDGEVYADDGGELLDGHWLSNSVVSGGQSVPAYVAKCSSGDLVATTEDNGSVTLGLATADGSYSVDANGADKVRISGKDGVKLEGQDVAFSLTAALDDAEGVAGIEVSAKAKGDVSATLEGDRLVVDNKGKMDNVVITVTEDGETSEQALDRSVESLTVVPSDDVGVPPTVIADGVKIDNRVSLAGAQVTGLKARVYTGKPRTQTPTVKVGGHTLKASTDYKLSYKNNVKVGTATMTVTGVGNYTGMVKKTFKIVKATNPMKVKAVKRTVKAPKVRNKAQVVAAPLKFTTKAQGNVAYKKVGGSKLLSVNKKTGKVTVRKGTKKGTYKVKVKVTAAGNANYKKASKTITCTVVVR